MKATDQGDKDSGLAWARAARATLEGGGSPTYDVWIVSIRAGRRAAVGARLERLFRSVRGRLGPVRVVMVEERVHHPGNLVGTLLSWRAACAQCADADLDLDGEWRAGKLRVVLVHGAGQGRRAAPLAHAEQGDRGSLLLPGQLHGQPTRLLEATMTQMMPFAESQPKGVLDVVWASQVFFPRVSPVDVPASSTPISKFVTTGATDESTDVGTFLLQDGAPVGFVPQGSATGRIAGDTASDLGSFRMRADALDALQRVYLAAPLDGHRDLDPHLTAPLFSGSGPTADEAAQVQDLLGTKNVIGIIDLGKDIPWWRLRRPDELRDCALDVRPSAHQPALRHLLGIDHPIARTWLGDQWIEGPELSWEQVGEGVVVGGVSIVDSTVQDCALHGWNKGGRSPVANPAIQSCVLSHTTGGLDLENCWVTLCGSAGLRGGGGLAWRVTSPPPPEAGPAPTATGLCEVRRPRLMDGSAVFFDFLDEDAKAAEHTIRGNTGVSWAKLARLPTYHGPNPEDFDALDAATPHRLLAIPPDVLSLLRSRLPSASTLATLVDLADAGAFMVALHQGSRPLVAVDGKFMPGRRFIADEGGYRLHLDTETWERWRWSTPRMAEAIVRCWCMHFLPCADVGREAFAQKRVRDWQRERYEANPAVTEVIDRLIKTDDVAGLLTTIDGWSIGSDPDRADLTAMFTALDQLNVKAGQVSTPAQLRAWSRWRLDHVGETAQGMTSQLSDVAPGLLEEVGLWWSHRWVDGGLRRWVPRVDLRPAGEPTGQMPPKGLADTLAARALALHRSGRPVVIGVCGPAAAGKSSLAVKLAEQLDGAGLSVGFVEADEACWQGDGFRYVQGESTRKTRLYGPVIVDEVGLARRVRRLRAENDIVVVEGCFVGLDPDVWAQIDLLVGVVLDDAERLSAKFARDALGGQRRIDVVTDFAAKTHHENIDGVVPALAKAHLIWDRGTGHYWER